MKLYIKLHIDWILLLLLAALCAIGLIVLYSAKPNLNFIIQQITRIIIATTVMLAIAQLHPRNLERWAGLIYLTILIMLIAVLVLGYSSKGAQRWLNLGIIRFQPAEFMKLAVPLMLAKYLSDCAVPLTIRHLILPILITLVPTILIALQPDLGTAIITAINGALVIFFAGISLRAMLSMLLVSTAGIPVLWYILHDYQKQRILTFLNPEQDPLGAGYHIIQSKIAIGSGGIYGKGWLQGSQAHLNFIPEQTTDFVFAVLAEEFGLIGIIIVLGLYFAIVIKGLKVSSHSHNSFSKLLAASLTMSFFMYAFINIGMTMGLLPVVGVPLPLISYGGTSMLTIMVSFGIVMAIYNHKSMYH